MDGNGALRCNSRHHGMHGTLEGHEEPIPRCVDLMPIPRLQGFAQQAPVGRQYFGIAVTQVLEKACRVFNVAE
jgi:hypothetical protein